MSRRAQLAKKLQSGREEKAAAAEKRTRMAQSKTAEGKLIIDEFKALSLSILPELKNTDEEAFDAFCVKNGEAAVKVVEAALKVLKLPKTGADRVASLCNTLTSFLQEEDTRANLRVAATTAVQDLEIFVNKIRAGFGTITGGVEAINGLEPGHDLLVGLAAGMISTKQGRLGCGVTTFSRGLPRALFGLSAGTILPKGRLGCGVTTFSWGLPQG